MQRWINELSRIKAVDFSTLPEWGYIGFIHPTALAYSLWLSEGNLFNQREQYGMVWSLSQIHHLVYTRT